MRAESADGHDEIPAIAKIEATPFPGQSNLDSRNEANLFQQFWRWLFPKIEKGADLTEAFGEAAVAERGANAKRVCEEAAEIAARREVVTAQAGTERQVEVAQFIANVEAIERLQSPAGRLLAFAKLVEKNPGIMQQVEVVETLVSNLGLQRGVMLTRVESPLKVQSESEGVIE
jgi:hypothetical protein